MYIDFRKEWIDAAVLKLQEQKYKNKKQKEQAQRNRKQQITQLNNSNQTLIDFINKLE